MTWKAESAKGNKLDLEQGPKLIPEYRAKKNGSTTSPPQMEDNVYRSYISLKPTRTTKAKQTELVKMETIPSLIHCY